MASSDHLVSIEQQQQQQTWQFRPTFADSWFSDIFNKETETLTKALPTSITDTNTHGVNIDRMSMVESLLFKPESTTPVQTPTGSENDAVPFSKQRKAGGPTGKVTKRKSRASKRATTTFITADPANFRQMVQQVTGVRFSSLNGPLSVVKPEPQRFVNRVQTGGCMAPGTFDASTFLLDHVGPISSMAFQTPVVDMQAAPPDVGVADGGLPGGFDFGSLCSFPTLESWKVM